MAELYLDIVAPSKSIFSGPIKSITVPGEAGSFQVLVNHAPLIGALEIGVIKVVLPAGKQDYYTIAGGTIEVLNNKVLVLGDSLENVNDINLQRALSANERAKARLSNKSDRTIDVERAENALKRSVNRLKAYEKYLKGEVPYV